MPIKNINLFENSSTKLRINLHTQHVTSNSSGYSFPFTRATVLSSFIASLFLPRVSNQLADSGMNLQINFIFLEIYIWIKTRNLLKV